MDQPPRDLVHATAPIHAILEAATGGSLPLDFTVAFDIEPLGVPSAEWTSILHFTASGNNCCEYGDRVPVRDNDAMGQ